MPTRAIPRLASVFRCAAIATFVWTVGTFVLLVLPVPVQDVALARGALQVPPDYGGCVVTGTNVAEPSRLRVGDSTTAKLGVSVQCQRPAQVDVIFAIDVSTSMISDM